MKCQRWVKNNEKGVVINPAVRSGNLLEMREYTLFPGRS
jgi:hypothetical protein